MLLLFVSMVVPVPVDTPIPCVICTATANATTTTFSGIIARVDAGGLRVFDFVTRRIMVFEVPPNFRAVQTGTGAEDGGSLADARPGLFARVTYVSSRGRNTAVRVLLLTGAQCRSYVAAEPPGSPAVVCPD